MWATTLQPIRDTENKLGYRFGHARKKYRGTFKKMVYTTPLQSSKVKECQTFGHGDRKKAGELCTVGNDANVDT